LEENLVYRLPLTAVEVENENDENDCNNNNIDDFEDENDILQYWDWCLANKGNEAAEDSYY
jgi:hypothetical protein